jgi:hypothetical protein
MDARAVFVFVDVFDCHVHDSGNIRMALILRMAPKHKCQSSLRPAASYTALEVLVHSTALRG